MVNFTGPNPGWSLTPMQPKYSFAYICIPNDLLGMSMISIERLMCEWRTRGIANAWLKPEARPVTSFITWWAVLCLKYCNHCIAPDEITDHKTRHRDATNMSTDAIWMKALNCEHSGNDSEGFVSYFCRAFSGACKVCMTQWRSQSHMTVHHSSALWVTVTRPKRW